MNSAQSPTAMLTRKRARRRSSFVVPAIVALVGLGLAGWELLGRADSQPASESGVDQGAGQHVDQEPEQGTLFERRTTDELPSAGPNQPQAEQEPLQGGVPWLEPQSPEELAEVMRYTRKAQAEQIPALKKATLESSDVRVVGHSLEALGRLGALTKDPELTAFLDDERMEVRHYAITGLGFSDDPKAVSLLSRSYDKENDRGRVLALMALGRIGSDEARMAARRALDRPGITETERAYARKAAGSKVTVTKALP